LRRRAFNTRCSRVDERRGAILPPQRHVRIVYWNLTENSALLGMFDKEPETLARILLSNRELGKYALRK